jgi:hypothetical protein
MDLGEHDGLPITKSTAQITGTGDGLSEDMAMRPLHLEAEADVVIVVPAKVRGHFYERVTEGRGKEKLTLEEFLERTTFRAQAAFLIDPDLLEEAIAKHVERRTAYRAEQERLKKEARGEFELPLPPTEGSNGTNGA